MDQQTPIRGSPPLSSHRNRPPRLPFPSLLFPSMLLLLFFFLFPSYLTALPTTQTQNRITQQRRPQVVSPLITERHSSVNSKMAALRARRQSRPREGLFQLYWRLASEASNDTGNAFSQIRELFSTLIEPSGGMSENIQAAGNSTTPASEEGEEANTTTTTTEAPPRKISTGELMTIFRRNVFGLGRLFGREFWNAIQDSNKNVEGYTKQWTDALRPFLE